MKDIVTAITNLKSDATYTLKLTSSKTITQEEYEANMKYVVGEDENGNAIYGDIPTELSWDKIKTEMEKA